MDELMVTVKASDLSAVLQAADYVNNRSLAGPVDRMSDALASATMKRELEKENKPHFYKNNISWSGDGLYEPWVAMSWDVVECNCDRPWRHAYMA